MQTRRRSVAEAITMTVLGLAYAIPLNWFLYSKVQWPSAWTFAVVNTLIFTVMSVIFKYSIRRLFNWLDVAYPSNTATGRSGRRLLLPVWSYFRRIIGRGPSS